MIRRHAVHSWRGPDFRRQRDELGLSLRYVAHVSGYPAEYLRGIETGSVALTVETAAVLDQTFTRIRRRMVAT